MRKQAAIISLSVILAFCFGWTACGYYVYSGFFNHQAAVLGALK